MNVTRIAYIVLVLLTGLWCAGIFAAPLFLHSAVANESRALYAFYSLVCHQLDARSFHVCGEKFGVCIRCTALYFSFFAGLIFYPFIRSFHKLSLPSKKIFLLILAPMLIDVCLNVVGLVHSTTLSRVGSGMIFGFFAPWFIFPSLVEAVHQIIVNIKTKTSGEVEYGGKTR
ncbi:MAG TPA: DUF2085 domain-containing protein [Bacteroidota bacterium]|nr:DUF2085 domain-containing protein [Bacteroidota bacterium]